MGECVVRGAGEQTYRANGSGPGGWGADSTDFDGLTGLADGTARSDGR